MNIVRRTTDFSFWAVFLVSLWLGGCSTDDIPIDQEVERISVPLTITGAEYHPRCRRCYPFCESGIDPAV